MKPPALPDYVIGSASFVPLPVNRPILSAQDLREQLRLANRLVYSLRGICLAASAGDGNPFWHSIAKDLARWEAQQL